MYFQNGTTLPCFAGIFNAIGWLADGQRGTSRFSNPKGIAFDGCGNLFVADNENHLIRMVDKNGNTTTVANVTNPSNLAFSVDGDLYVTSPSRHRIAKISFP